MDIYQSNLLNRGIFSFVSELGVEKIVVNDTITLYQNENYKAGNYKILLSNSSVSAVLYNGKEYPLSKDGKFIVDIDLSNAGNVLTIVFKNGVADDCTLPLKIVFADKNAFDEKEAEAFKQQLIANVCLNVANGVDLLNIFWKKAHDSVTKSVVKVFFIGANERFPVLEKEEDSYFVPVCGLAFGQYLVVIEEYDSKGKLVVTASSSVQLKDIYSDLKATLGQKLDDVKGMVRATGLPVVCR